MEQPKIRAIIVDDEMRSRRSLRNLLEKYVQKVTIIGEAENIDNAIPLIDKTKPNLLFLDIQLKHGTSFEILRKIKHKDYFVIFITAFDEYAIKAFKFSAIDYLLKPVSLEELIDAVNKVDRIERPIKEFNSKKINNLLSFNRLDPTITIHTDHSVEFLRIFDILRLQADGSYTTFYLNNTKPILSSKHLKYYESILEDYNFYRIHQSHLINMSHIK
ncbi:MAG: response regulator transcription factor, partial [Bacteroidia bacterium]|nr:response regulator transcription factor [Bacteroidia bacterium]